MPLVVCPVCGRIVNIATRPEARDTEEQRCPRCGARLEVERRAAARGQNERRPDDRPRRDDP